MEFFPLVGNTACRPLPRQWTINKLNFTYLNCHKYTMLLSCQQKTGLCFWEIQFSISADLRVCPWALIQQFSWLSIIYFTLNVGSVPLLCVACGRAQDCRSLFTTLVLSSVASNVQRSKPLKLSLALQSVISIITCTMAVMKLSLHDQVLATARCHYDCADLIV